MERMDVKVLVEQTFHLVNGAKVVNHWGEYERGTFNGKEVIIFDAGMFLNKGKVVLLANEIGAVTHKKTDWVRYANGIRKQKECIV